jgi:hypothetical protein
VDAAVVDAVVVMVNSCKKIKKPPQWAVRGGFASLSRLRKNLSTAVA